MKLRNLVLAAVLGVSACGQKPVEENQQPPVEKELTFTSLASHTSPASHEQIQITETGVLSLSEQGKFCAENPGVVLQTIDKEGKIRGLVMCGFEPK